MAISPLAGPLMPDELKLKYFEKLKFPDLQNAARVCKNWFEVSCDAVLWKPIFKELSKQYTCNEGEEVKSAALRNLHQAQKFVNQVIALTGNEEQLADVIDCPLETVKRFPTMLPIERSWHVIRGLSCDCTKMLQKFPDLFANQVYQYLHQNLTPEQKTPAGYHEGAMLRVTREFYKQDWHLYLFLNLVKTPPGFFDVKQAFLAAINLSIKCSHPPTSEVMLMVSASIVKSHSDLSEFFKENINIGNEVIGLRIVPATRFVSEIIIPNMEAKGMDVTLEDWMKCGYKPPDQ
jgi:hypothetical protein